MTKPKARPVFTGLLIAAIMRMFWFWLIGKKVADTIGLVAISIAVVALVYLSLFHPGDDA